MARTLSCDFRVIPDHMGVRVPGRMPDLEVGCRRRCGPVDRNESGFRSVRARCRRSFLSSCPPRPHTAPAAYRRRLRPAPTSQTCLPYVCRNGQDAATTQTCPGCRHGGGQADRNESGFRPVQTDVGVRSCPVVRPPPPLLRHVRVVDAGGAYRFLGCRPTGRKPGGPDDVNPPVGERRVNAGQSLGATRFSPGGTAPQEPVCAPGVNNPDMSE